MGIRKPIKDADIDTVGELLDFLGGLSPDMAVRDVFGDRICIAHVNEDGDEYLEVT